MHTEYSDRYITMGLKIAYYRKKAGFTQEVLVQISSERCEDFASSGVNISV